MTAVAVSVLFLLLYAGILWWACWSLWVHHQPTGRSESSSIATAELLRHQASRAIELGLLNNEIHQNGDRMRRELREEMDRFDG